MKRLLKILISLIGFGVGIGVSQALRQFLDDARLLVNLSSMGYFFTVLGVYLAGAILFAFIFYLISGPIIRRCERIVNGSEAELRSVTVAQEARIQGGTGNLELEDCQLTDASFYMGVGELRMQGWLKGQSYMEQGIGTVTLELDNAAEESFVSVETGIGDVRIYQGGATQWQGGGISGQGCAYGDEEAADRLTVQGGLGSLRIYLQ